MYRVFEKNYVHSVHPSTFKKVFSQPIFLICGLQWENKPTTCRMKTMTLILKKKTLGQDDRKLHPWEFKISKNMHICSTLAQSDMWQLCAGGFNVGRNLQDNVRNMKDVRIQVTIHHTELIVNKLFIKTKSLRNPSDCRVVCLDTYPETVTTLSNLCGVHNSDCKVLHDASFLKRFNPSAWS